MGTRWSSIWSENYVIEEEYARIIDINKCVSTYMGLLVYVCVLYLSEVGMIWVCMCMYAGMHACKCIYRVKIYTSVCMREGGGREKVREK